jgi:hypothetical protein
VIVVGRVANCVERGGMPKSEVAKDGKRLVAHFGVGVALKRLDDSWNDIGHTHVVCSTPLTGQAVESDLSYWRHWVVKRCKENRSGLVGSVMVEQTEAAPS